MAMANLARRKAYFSPETYPTLLPTLLDSPFPSLVASRHLDVISGGYAAAIKAAQLSLKTTCIEKRGALGGTCLNVDCIPSKALLLSPHMYHEAKHAYANHDIRLSSVEVDLPAVLAQKDNVVQILTRGIEALFKKNKVNYVKGYGKFISPTEVSVDTYDGGNTVVRYLI